MALSTINKIREKIEDSDVSKTFTFNTSDNRIKLYSDDERDDDYFLKRRKAEYKIIPSAFPSLMRSINLPVALTNKISAYPELMTYNVNYMMDHNSVDIRAMCRGKSIVGFMNPAHTIIPNSQVLDVIERTMGKDAIIDHYSIENNGLLDLCVRNEEKADKFMITKDDYVQSGIHVVNSPFGYEQTSIEGYLLRLACTNGNIDNESIFKAPRQVGDDSESWLRTNIRDAIRSAGGLFKGIKKLRNKEIGSDIAGFMANLFEELNIDESIQNKILKRVSREGADSLYDVFNHMTYIASHDSEIRDDPVIRNKLMRTSSHYVNHIQDICGSCNRPQFV